MARISAPSTRRNWLSSAAGGIGLIYQFYNLILNVEENITLPLLLDGRTLDEPRLNEIVATLGLADRIRHLPLAFTLVMCASGTANGHMKAVFSKLQIDPAKVLARENLWSKS